MSTGISAPRPALAALLFLLSASAPSAAVVEEIVAKVNNRIITRSEFEERGAFVLRQVYEEFTGAELDRNLKEAQDTLLANMITELLLLERAESLLDLERVRQNLIEDFRKQQNIATDEELARLLKEQEMTRADLEEQLLRLAVPQEIISYEVRRKISVSESEIKDHYAKHVKEWETPATVTFREIVLFYEKVNRDEVEIRVQGLVRELKGGADFLELVGRASESGTKQSGGLLGPLAASEIHPALAAAAFALEPGEFSDPVDTGRSFHLLRLDQRTGKTVKSLEEARETILNALRQEKFRPRYDRFLKRLWRENQVEVLPKYRSYLVASPLDPVPRALPAPGETLSPEAPAEPPPAGAPSGEPPSDPPGR
ncbi:MAG: peptidyl-prolyl cis-trans isomerase [Candidatus Polarisedimenticolia bacterium]